MRTEQTTRILVVDGNVEMTALVASTLTSAGYQVTVADGGERALDALCEDEYHLVLTGIDAAAPDGRSLLSTIRSHARLSETPVLVLISAQPFERRLPPDEPRADAYLRAPFEPGELLHYVNRALDRQRLPQSGDIQELQRRLERQLLELNTLSAIGQSLTSELGLDTLLTRVAEAAANLTDAEESLLLLLDEESNELIMRAQKGFDSKTAESFRIKSADSMAFRVLKSGAPLLVDSTEGWQKIKTEYLVKSMVYVPLSIRGKPIGVLGVNNRLSDRNFTSHDVDLLLALAGNAATAIYNARLYEESEERRRELRTLIEIGRAVSSTLALDQVLETINAQIMRIFNVGWCFIFSWAEGRTLHALAESRQTVWTPDLAPRLDPSGYPTLNTCLREERWYSFDAEAPASDPADVDRLRYQGALTCLRVPLATEGGLVGMVEFRYHDRHEGFSDLFVSRLRSQARPIAAALAEDNYLRKANDLLKWTRDLATTANADWCTVRWWDEKLAQLVNVCTVGSTVWLDSPSQPLNVDAYPTLLDALRNRALISGTVRDATPNLAASLLLKHAGGQALLGVPLVAKGQTVGLLLLIDTLNARQFTRREEFLARGIADQAAIAIENARLFRELEKSMADLRQAQSSLVMAARLSAMGELAAAVAHQINNPLTTILGDAELLLQDLSPETPGHESAAAIYRAGQRAREVVRRLLGMARHDSDESLKPTDVNFTIRNVLALAERHLAHSGVTLHTRLADALPPVNAIPSQLEDVWLNLLLNAKDAVPEQGGEIGVETRLAGDGGAPCVEVAVWDNGHGIAPEDQARIFEPFFTTKPIGEGTGLGLHICRQVVERCGGAIRVESAPGQGSRFLVSLPASDPSTWTTP